MSDATATAPRRLGNPWLLLPLAVFAGLAALFLLRIGHDPAALPSKLIGAEAPPIALPPLAGLTRDGQPVEGLTSADLKAGGIVLLNVFASWCVPCREEHPELLELAKDPRVTLVGLNYKDEADNARRFLGVLGNPYARVGVDLTGRTAIDLGVYGVPETFAIDSSGRIVGKHVGALTASAAENLIRQAKGSAP